MKEENETFLKRVSYAMFRYGLGLYSLSGMVSLLGLVGSFLLKRFSWYWGLPFVVCGILFLVVFPLALFLLSVDDWRQEKHVEENEIKVS
jgi:MFS family permease